MTTNWLIAGMPYLPGNGNMSFKKLVVVKGNKSL